MSATLLEAPTKRPAPTDPFRLGWRFVPRIADDGSEIIEQVPLTEWDILHPEEGDFIVQNEEHTRNCIYLRQSFESVFRNRPDVSTFCDHRVDWQEPGVLPHGPDITVVSGVREPWDPKRGTFPVRDMGAAVLLVVEVTSPSTWKTDVYRKRQEYARAKIPFYVIADNLIPHEEGKDPETIDVVGLRLTPQGYSEIESDPLRGTWIPSVELWFKGEGRRVIMYDRDGNRIPDQAELEKLLAEIQTRAAEAELLAQVEKARAEQEKARADEAEARIRELEAQIKKTKRPRK